MYSDSPQERQKEKMQSKSEAKGEYAQGRGSCRPWQMLEVCWGDGAGQRGTEGLQPGTVTPPAPPLTPTCGLHTFEPHNPTPSHVHIPPLSSQTFGEMSSPPQLSPLGGSGHPSHRSGGGRAVTCVSHIAVACSDSKRRGDPSCLPLLCQQLPFCRKELAA